jgi:hypothetical protein
LQVHFAPNELSMPPRASPLKMAELIGGVIGARPGSLDTYPRAPNRSTALSSARKARRPRVVGKEDVTSSRTDCPGAPAPPRKQSPHPSVLFVDATPRHAARDRRAGLGRGTKGGPCGGVLADGSACCRRFHSAPFHFDRQVLPWVRTVLFRVQETGLRSHGVGMVSADGSVVELPGSDGSFAYWDPGRGERGLVVMRSARTRTPRKQVPDNANEVPIG